MPKLVMANISLISSRLLKAGLLLLFIFLVYLINLDYLSFAQSSDQNIRIVYKNNLLTLSAKDADLKNVLLKLAYKTNIKVWFPNSLKKKITIKFSKISLGKSLEKLLKGLNHVILYSGPSKGQAAVSGVYVFKKSKKSGRVRASERQKANRIRAYERRIESLKSQLSRIDVNSRRGKSYLRQIQRLENNIERLQR